MRLRKASLVVGDLTVSVPLAGIRVLRLGEFNGCSVRRGVSVPLAGIRVLRLP